MLVSDRRVGRLPFEKSGSGASTDNEVQRVSHFAVGRAGLACSTAVFLQTVDAVRDRCTGHADQFVLLFGQRLAARCGRTALERGEPFDAAGTELSHQCSILLDLCAVITRILLLPAGVEELENQSTIGCCCTRLQRASGEHSFRYVVVGSHGPRPTQASASHLAVRNRKGDGQFDKRKHARRQRVGCDALHICRRFQDRPYCISTAREGRARRSQVIQSLRSIHFSSKSNADCSASMVIEFPLQVNRCGAPVSDGAANGSSELKRFSIALEEG